MEKKGSGTVGDAIRRRRYRLWAVHARSKIYLSETAGRLPLFVVAPSIGAGPLNWVLGDAARAKLPEVLDFSAELPTGARYDSRIPRALPEDAAARLGDVVRAELPGLAPTDSLVSLVAGEAAATPFQRHRDEFLRPHLPAFAAALAGRGTDARLLAAIGAFRGCGTGSTPSGDDFLSGFFLRYRLERGEAPKREWLAAALGENPISNAFLKLAHAGRIHAPFRAFLLAPSRATLEPVVRFGHSSGADLLSAFL